MGTLNYYASLLDSAYKNIKSKLIYIIKNDNPESVAISLDAWSQHHNGYLGINCNLKYYLHSHRFLRFHVSVFQCFPPCFRYTLEFHHENSERYLNNFILFCHPRGARGLSIYINEWQRKILNLCCTPFNENHTSIHIGENVDNILKDFEILEKVQIALHDNASNMVKAFTFKSGIKGVGCLSHSL